MLWILQCELQCPQTHTVAIQGVNSQLIHIETVPQAGQKDVQQHEQKHRALQQSLQQAQLQNSNLQQAFEDAQRAQQTSASRVSSACVTDALSWQLLQNV